MDTAQGKTHSEAIGAVQLHFTIYQCNYSVPAAFQVHWLQGKLHFFFFFFGYKLLRSFILREFEILKYNFIPPISPTLWPLAFVLLFKDCRVQDMVVSYRCHWQRHAWGRNPDVSTVPQGAENSGPKGTQLGESYAQHSRVTSLRPCRDECCCLSILEDTPAIRTSKAPK